MTQRTRRLALGVVALAVVLLGAGAGSASAEQPVDVTGPVTDPTGVLGGRAGDVREALDRFFDATGQQLFVVYVATFDGQDGQAWADASAVRSGLRPSDVLLAVATDERAYGYSVDDGQAISDSDLARVENEDLVPALRDQDWAGAGIAAADGLTEAAEPGGVSWTPLITGGGVVAAAAAGAGTLLVRRSRRSRGTSRADLDRRCGTALVAVDDALKTSQQELAYAEAQFGRDATVSFRQALDEARERAKAAFGLRQTLDDSESESDEEHARLSMEIITLCDKVDAVLDEQVEAFDALRDLQSRVPEVLADMAVRAADVEKRLTAARATLTQLLATHPASVLASVTGNADQAQALLTEATRQTGLGSAAVTADDRPTAVVHARAAEDSVAQARTLLDAIDRAEADIAAAPQQIAERLISLGLDLDDAARLASGERAITAAAATARETITSAGQVDTDPLAAVQRLDMAEAVLDELLAPVRSAAAEAEKARVALTELLGRVTSRVQSVSDFIETRRGAVGAEARTRLSEAARHLDRAQQLVQTDPAAALEALTKADGLIDDAERRARDDVAAWGVRTNPPSAGTARGSGGDSMVLGGILLDGLLGGGGGGGINRGSSTRRRSTSRSSGRRSSSRSPGSFGGSSTRGRRGGGGKF